MLAELEYQQIETSLQALIDYFDGDPSDFHISVLKILDNYRDKPRGFDMVQEDFHNGHQYLHIVEKGESRFELWQWKHHDHQNIYVMMDKLQINKFEIYQGIKKSADLLKTTETWSEIRGKQKV